MKVELSCGCCGSKIEANTWDGTPPWTYLYSKRNNDNREETNIECPCCGRNLHCDDISEYSDGTAVSLYCYRYGHRFGAKTIEVIGNKEEE